MELPTRYNEYSEKHHIEGLSIPTLDALMKGDYDLGKARDFLEFQDCVNHEMLNHKVIAENPYTQWFANAELTLQQVKHFIVQFSVFSNQFLVAQLLKMLAADNLKEMHASKEILANEIGVVFNKRKTMTGNVEGVLERVSKDEKDFGSTTGSIEGGVFHFRAAHFELLVRTAEPLGLGFSDLGKRAYGTTQTLHYCDELKRLYGSEDYLTSTTASYAVENWAAAGFWDELVNGLENFRNHNDLHNMPLTFFTWHSKVEANHARHTQEELEQFYFEHEVDWDRFIREGNEMLDGVYTFWHGLDKQRRCLH